MATRALALLGQGAPEGGPRYVREGMAARLRSRVVAASQRRGWRFDPGVRGAAAMGTAALVALIVAGWWVMSARPHATALAPSAVSSSVSLVPTRSGSTSASASGSSTSVVVINVVGRVQTPGVYRLPTGSRVDDALRAAGGALPGTDLTTVNLARKLVDGEQIAVGVAGEPVSAGSASAAASTGPIDLNTASAAQLDALPGVGPVLAQHIVDWRTAHGRFDSIDQLREVAGIGEAKYAQLRPLVSV